MITSLWIFVGGIASLTVFVVLFNSETKRGKRILLEGMREGADRGIIRFQLWQHRAGITFGSGTLRIVLHFLAHRFLSLLLGVLKSSEAVLVHLERRNKSVAKAVRVAQEKNHLDLIAEHKDMVALSEKDKELLKRRSMEGE